MAKVPPASSSADSDAALRSKRIRHPFDTSKWGRICEFLISERVVNKNQIVEPVEASKDDLLVVHTEEYLASLKSGLNVAIIVEVPPVAILPNCLIQQKLLFPFRKQGNLQKNEVGPLMLVVVLTTVPQEKEADFVHMQTFHFAYIMHLNVLTLNTLMLIKGMVMRWTLLMMEGFIPLICTIGTYTFKILRQGHILPRRLNWWLLKGHLILNWFFTMREQILDGDPLGRSKVSPTGIIAKDEKVFQFARQRNIPILMLSPDFRWLYEVKYSSHSRFNKKSEHETFD